MPKSLKVAARWRRRTQRWTVIAVAFATLAIGGLVEAKEKAGESFRRWVEARERWACEAAAKAEGAQFVCEEAANAVKGYPPYPRMTILDEPNEFIRILRSSEGRNKQKEEADSVQFFRDYGAATERGISIEAVVKERLVANELFNRWLEARERWTCDAAAKAEGPQFFCEEAAWAVEGYPSYSSPASLDALDAIVQDRFLGRMPLSSEGRRKEKQRIDLGQFENDRAEADRRNIAIEAVLKDRLEALESKQREEEARRQEEAREEEARRQEEAREEEALQRRPMLIASVSVATAIAILFKTRRRIAGGWRRRSKAFRTWVFASLFWSIGVLLFVIFVDPYDDFEGNVIGHMLGVMLVPPLFLGGIWFGYKRLVE